ncbi:MAG: M48 family metalloprotease [Burkholderiales bacterium]
MSSSLGANPSLPPRPERTSFFDEQQRNRQTSRYYAWLSYALVAVMCLVMSVLLAPLLWGLIGLLVDIVNLVLPMPNMLGSVWKVVDHAIEGLDKPGAISGLLPLAAYGAIPGLLILALLWRGVRALFERAGVYGIIASLPVRAPNTADLEEKQLVNVVEEMAIAAAIPCPKIMLTDQHGVNCGAIGTGIDDAVVIVSRGLLDRFDRTQTQGIVAHLIASIGNGDMRIGMLMMSVMQMLSALSLVVYAPVDRNARAMLMKLMRLGMECLTKRPTATDAGQEAQWLAEILANPFHDRLEHQPDDTRMGKVMTVLAFPAMLVDIIFSKVLNLFLLSPILALTWRHRKYLADSAAVQLTRYPDGLADALANARTESRVIPGGNWAAHMYVFDTRADVDVLRAIATAQGNEEISFRTLVRHVQGTLGRGAGGSADMKAQYQARLQQAMAAARAANPGGQGGLAASATMSFLPSTRRRIRRLQAMGAQTAALQAEIAGQWKAWLLMSPVAIVLAALVSTLCALGAWLVMAMSMLVVALPVGVIHLLLRWIAP